MGLPNRRTLEPLTRKEIEAQRPKFSKDYYETFFDGEDADYRLYKNPKKFFGPHVTRFNAKTLQRIMAGRTSPVTLYILSLQSDDSFGPDLDLLKYVVQKYDTRQTTRNAMLTKAIKLFESEYGDETLPNEVYVFSYEHGIRGVVPVDPNLSRDYFYFFMRHSRDYELFTFVRSAARTEAATKIQAAWRGRKNREEYMKRLERHYAPGGIGAARALEHARHLAGAPRQSPSPVRRRARPPSKATNTGRKDAKGRAIMKTERGRLYVLGDKGQMLVPAEGRKWKPTKKNLKTMPPSPRFLKKKALSR